MRVWCPNDRLQRTVRDKVPRHIRQRAAAELRRYLAKIPVFRGHSPDAISMAVFYAQSAVLHRSITCAAIRAAETAAVASDMARVGSDASLVALVRANLALVDHARRRVLG
jgi:hypothetical protein